MTTKHYDRPMTPGERKAFSRLINKIRKALMPWMKRGDYV